MRIMIIDDSDLVRTGLRALLEGAGMRVFDRDSGIGATRSIMQHDIDAVVLDLNMPGIGGDRLVGVLRNNRRLRDLAIVVVSALSWSALQSAAGNIGADALLPKEHVQDELVPLLRKLAARRPVRAAQRPLHHGGARAKPHPVSTGMPSMAPKSKRQAACTTESTDWGVGPPSLLST